MSRVRLLIALASIPAIAGCTTFGTNVKGDFSCRAPDGICAPSSVIDDRALALIAGEEVKASAPRGPAAQLAVLRSRSVALGQVAHAGQQVLRIVFPAHVDALGRYHEPSVVRAVVDGGTWLAAEPSAASVGTAALASPTSPPATPGAPSEEAVRAARARVQATPVAREAIAAEVEREVARAAANAPAGFPARVED